MHALTGQDLISWSAEKYGPITSYSLATVANKVELTTDAEGNYCAFCAIH